MTCSFVHQGTLLACKKLYQVGKERVHNIQLMSLPQGSRIMSFHIL
jgi:hypothetical protein